MDLQETEELIARELEVIPEEDLTKPPPTKTLRIGSARQVWNGTAEMTAGRLRKSDLMRNRKGKIVSIKKHQHALKLVAEGKLKPFGN